MTKHTALLLIILTFVFSKLAFAQGLNFKDVATGEAVVSDLADGSLALDLSKDAAKRIYEQLKSNRSSRHGFAKNANGENSAEAYQNGEIICSKLIRFESYSCRITVPAPTKSHDENTRSPEVIR